ncbi:MAG: hypothetical protein DBY02_04755 [Coprobacter fastidiosus]|nr:MAG: hypothetical protein DBY02_04755 [Coprobacter fastidiosus]
MESERSLGRIENKRKSVLYRFVTVFIYGNISLYGFILLYLSGMVRDFVLEPRFLYSYFILIKLTN